MGAPAQAQHRIVASCAADAGSASSRSRVIWTKGVAVMLIVHWCSAIRRRPASASQTSIRWTPAPRISGAMTPMARPVAWVTGDGMNITSPGPIAITSPPRACTVKVIVFRVCRQPFGRDSVPEV